METSPKCPLWGVVQTARVYCRQSFSTVPLPMRTISCATEHPINRVLRFLGAKGVLYHNTNFVLLCVAVNCCSFIVDCCCTIHCTVWRGAFSTAGTAWSVLGLRACACILYHNFFCVGFHHDELRLNGWLLHVVGTVPTTWHMLYLVEWCNWNILVVSDLCLACCCIFALCTLAAVPLTTMAGKRKAPKFKKVAKEVAVGVRIVCSNVLFELSPQ